MSTSVVDAEDYTVNVIELIGQYLEERLLTRGNPADNTGSEFENDTFLISAYDWRDDSDLPEGYRVPNFWYKPLNYQVEWYKHIGRGTYANRPLSIDEALGMFVKIIESLQDSVAVIEASSGDPFWEEEDDSR